MIDAAKNSITVSLDDEELNKRRRSWQVPPVKAVHGILKKYAYLVSSASEGCVTDEFAERNISELNF
jgi:dihydroxy-acid dehydratase